MSYSVSLPSALSFVMVRTWVPGRKVLLLLILAVSVHWLAVAQMIQTLPGVTSTGSAATEAVTVTFYSPGTLSSFTAVTQGVAGQDFAATSGGSCHISQVYASGAQCTVMVTFTPAYPGLRMGAVFAEDAGNIVIGTGLVQGQAAGALPMFVPGTVNTFAGQGDWTYTGDGVPATSAPIFTPKGVLLDVAGNIYLADNGNNRIRRVDSQTGTITTIAGSGSPGYSGDSGPALSAEIDSPAGLAMDGAGNIYIADELNNLVRCINASSHIITTVAGTPQVRGYAGDGSVATSAQLNRPLGVSFDLHGNLLIADTGNHVIRIVDAVTGNIRTLVGTGVSGFNGDNQLATSAQLNGPTATLVLPDGTLLISDTGNNRVRRVDVAGQITTIAGNGSPRFQGDAGPATAASLKEPIGLAVDPSGNLYIADSGNNRVRIVSTGTHLISTLIGTDSEGFSGDNGPANLASTYGPFGLFFTQDGTLFFSDFFHMRIRAIVADKLNLSYPTIRRGKTSTPQIVTLVNNGNAPLQLSTPVFNRSALDTATTTCGTTSALSTTQTCNLGVEFAPTVTGDDVIGSLALPSNTTNITPAIRLDGKVLDVNPTSAVVISSKNPSVLGDALTFTATVTSDDTGRTGNVTITSDGTALCTMALRSDGTATCSTSGLTVGSHAIVAQYTGDPQNASATSASLTQVVKQQTMLTLASSSNPVTVTLPVTFTLTASAATGTPTGNIIFLDGAMTLGTAVLNSGQASLTISTLAPGPHSIVAQYSGDTADAAEQHTLTQTVAQAGTATTLATSNASPNVGDTISFSVNVSSVNGLKPTGTVQFTDGSTVLGTATVGNTGSASFSTNALNPGTHAIVATYSGDTDNATSSSAQLAETVHQIATTVTLMANSNPLSAGATLHLSSQITMAGQANAAAALTGTLTFAEGNTTVGTASLDASQQGGTDVHNLSVGTHLLHVTYSGNTNYATSTNTLTVTVSQTTTNVSLTDAAGTTLAGQPAAWTTVVTSGTGTPTGTVIFRDGIAPLGTATLDAHGVASLSTLTLPVGSHTITAVYNGDANYLAVTSAPITHVVNLASPVLSLTGPAAAVYVTANTTFSLTLSHPGVTPTGTITLLDGASILGTQPVAPSGQNTFSTSSLALGQHSITAIYSGDADNASAASAAWTVTVQKAPTVSSLTSSSNRVILGAAVSLTASISAPTANLTGTVNFLDGTQIIGSAVLINGSATFSVSQLSFGHHSLTAAYVGDTVHSASSSSPTDESVIQQAIASVNSTLSPSNSGQDVTFTATLQPVAGLTPVGSITFTDSGTALGHAALDFSGHATLQTSGLTVGTHTIVVSFAGDTNFSSATASLMQTVQSSTSMTAETVSANPAIYGAPLTITATVSTNGGAATGQVLFTENGTTLGSAQLGATGIAILTTSALAPGRHSIIASYQTDGRTNASASSQVSFLVQQKTSLALSFDNNPALALSAINITATLTNSNAAPAGGDIFFFDGTARLGSATLNGGHAVLAVPLLLTGTHTISAAYAGDDDDFAATAPAVNEIVNQRTTTTSLTSSATNTADPQQVTLIALVESPALAATAGPGGTITFTQGAQVIGIAPITRAGLATLNQELEVSSKETVVATYNGDANYLASSSASIDVQSGAPANFTITLNATQVQMQSGQHSTMTLTLASIKGFNDSIRLGCAGLPYAATCTFTTTNIALAADGSAELQMMLDTGDPLGEGATSSAANRQPGPRRAPLLCFLPAAILLMLFRGRRIVPVLAAILLLSAVTVGNSGCSGLRMASTPAGTYTFQVTGAGVGSGAKQTQTVKLVVTQ